MNGYENVIIADADYLDKVAFDLIVNFERMLMRRIPPADIARWIDCVALDGGMRPAEGRPTATDTRRIGSQQGNDGYGELHTCRLQ